MGDLINLFTVAGVPQDQQPQLKLTDIKVSCFMRIEWVQIKPKVEDKKSHLSRVHLELAVAFLCTQMHSVTSSTLLNTYRARIIELERQVRQRNPEVRSQIGLEPKPGDTKSSSHGSSIGNMPPVKRPANSTQTAASSPGTDEESNQR